MNPSRAAGAALTEEWRWESIAWCATRCRGFPAPPMVHPHCLQSQARGFACPWEGAVLAHAYILALQHGLQSYNKRKKQTFFPGFMMSDGS